MSSPSSSSAAQLLARQAIHLTSTIAPSLAARSSATASASTSASTSASFSLPLPDLDLDLDLEVCDALLSSLINHGYAPITHDLFPSERLLYLTAMGKMLFYEIIPRLEDTEREKLRTSQHFRGLYQFFPLTGKGGKPTPIDCFSFGREVDDAASLRRNYFANGGFEKEEYWHKIERRNPTAALRSPLVGVSGSEASSSSSSPSEILKPIANAHQQECIDSLLAAHRDLHLVSMDALTHLATAMGIKPSLDIVRPTPEAAVDERYFVPYHDKEDHNLVLSLHRALVERQPIVDVNISAAQRKGSALTAPRVLRRKTAVADLTSQSGSSPSATKGTPTSTDDGVADQSSPSASAAFSLSRFDEQLLCGQLSKDLPPIPDQTYSTVNVLMPDVSGLGLEGVCGNNLQNQKPNPTDLSSPSSSFLLPTPFEIYNEEMGTFDPLVLPISPRRSNEGFSSSFSPSTLSPFSIPMALTSGVFLEKWTDGLIPAARVRERLLGDTHNKALNEEVMRRRRRANDSNSKVFGGFGEGKAKAESLSSSAAATPAPTSTDLCNLVYYCAPNWDAVIDPFTAEADYDPNNKGGASFVAGDIMPTE